MPPEIVVNLPASTPSWYSSWLTVVVTFALGMLSAVFVEYLKSSIVAAARASNWNWSLRFDPLHAAHTFFSSSRTLMNAAFLGGHKENCPH